MHQTWLTQCTKHPASDMHTVGVHHVCHDIGRRVCYGSLFRLTLKVNGHYQWDILLCYLNKCQLLSNTSLMTILFSAGQHTGTACMQHIQTAGSELSTSLLLIMTFRLTAQQWSQLIMRFRDSHISMSISCESTRLNKSTSDWLKSHVVEYSIRMKRCDFVFFCLTR